MQLMKFVIVLSATLVTRICVSEALIEITKPDKFAELEKAAIKTLTTCYPNKDKTVVLIGDFPGSFVKELSSHHFFGLVLMYDVKGHGSDFGQSFEVVKLKKHKVHIVVAIASVYQRFGVHINRYVRSLYDDSNASLIVLSWSPTKKQGACRNTWDIINIVHQSNWHNMLNANLICYNTANRITVYTVNPFTNRIPEPWQLVESHKDSEQHDVHLLVREYRGHSGMCKNLDFDKTQDLGGREIRIVGMFLKSNPIRNGSIPLYSPNRRIRIQEMKRLNFIDVFVGYVNASRKYFWREFDPNVIDNLWNPTSLTATPFMLKSVIEVATHTYPHGQECVFIVTHFRGHKSQLQKILSVIDHHSWIGMGMVYLITLMFFKYFLRQSLLPGILNLFRLTCGYGLLTLPSNVASRIYLSCLLMFVVTMQGIFVGNLAALLTCDIPVQQVDSVQNLAEFGYTIYAHPRDFVIFEDPVFDGRVRESLSAVECLAKVLGDSSSACLTWGADRIEFILQHNLYMSPGCISIEYVCNAIPWRWYLQEKINTFLGNAIATDTMMPLDAMVDEKRFLEADAQKTPFEPRIMDFHDLRFAFVILGIGFGFALVTFIIEVIVSLYHHRLAKRVTFFK